MDHQLLKQVFDDILQSQLSNEKQQWFSDRLERVADANDAKQAETFFYITFSSLSRKLGQADLTLSNDQQTSLENCCGEVSLSGWRIADLGRCRLLLQLDWSTARASEIFESLADTGDNGELIAIYRSLAFLPNPSQFVLRAREGLRTNVADVFKALAHNNEFPRQFLPDEAWNQLVLKALFVGAALTPIKGLDARANAELTDMLCDYARERWAAERSVKAELWRPVVLAPTAMAKADMTTALQSSDPRDHQAVAFALDWAKSDLLGDLRQGVQFPQQSWDDFAD